MLFSIGQLGYATLLSALVAVALGGLPVAGGVRLSFNTLERTLNITPLVVFKMPHAELGAFTIGGTALVFNRNLHTDTVYRYELEHAAFYEQFGLLYPLYAFGEPCRYDPASDLGRGCGTGSDTRTFSRLENPATATPNHGAFSIRFP